MSAAGTIVPGRYVIDMTTDPEAIRSLVALHAQLIDDGNVDERVKLYTEDGELVYAGVSSVGREALAKAFASTVDPQRLGRHMCVNTVVDLDDGRAEVRTDFMLVRASSTGVRVAAAGRYLDVMEKHAGQWLFRQRRVQVIETPPPAP